MLKKMSLRGKLLFVLGVLSVVAIVISYVGITKLGSLNGKLNQIVEVISTRQLLAARMQQDLLAIHRAEKNLILAQTTEEMDTYAKAMETFEKAMEEKQKKLEAIASEEGKKELEKFKSAYARYKEVSRKACEASRQNTNAQAFVLSSGTGQELFNKSAQDLIALANNSDKLVTDVLAELKKASSDEVKVKLDQVNSASTRALLSARAVQDFVALQRAEKNYILETTKEGMDKLAQEITDLDKSLRQKLDQIKATATEEGKRSIEAFISGYDAWLANNKKVRDFSLQNSNEAARAMSGGDGRKAMEEAQASMKAIEDLNDATMNAMADQTDKDYAIARMTMLAVSIGGIIFALALGLMIIQGLVKALTLMINSLREGSEQVSSAAGQVSAASQSLAEGATEQAAGLEETSSSLEEMSSMTKQNADNAQQANTLAAEAKKAAGTGAESMGRMNQAIRDIQKSSDETAKIIKVIDEIAFQTNLLALNAAVEAARAGEAGKGFAVVAEEVRNLAMRSAEAAKNTARMIEESVKNSKNGVDIATEVGKVLDEIVGSVGKTTDLVSEIAAASQEQAQGIDQVNTAVAQMDKVTQQNAANAEESASASEELSAQAESMNAIVGELVAVVGGAASKATLSVGPKKAEHHLHVNLEHKAPKIEKAVSKAHAFGKSDEAFHKIAHHAEPSKRATANKPAGKSIPLDSHEDDLSTFNN